MERKLLCLLLLLVLLLAACATDETPPTASPAPDVLPTDPPPEEAIATDPPPTEPAATATATELPPTDPPPAVTAVPDAQPGDEPVTLQINPDGSGDLPTLAAAVAFAAAGSTIQLAAGTFDLPQSLAIDRPLTITGAGREETRLATQAAEAGIAYSGDGTLALSDLTISHAGLAAADLINVAAGELQLSGCRLEGGKRAPQQAFYGAAVFARNDSRVSATDCEFLDNEGAGVEAIHNAVVNLQDGVLRGNGAGVIFDGASSGTISGTLIEHNDSAGIYLFGQAAPEITNNLIRVNGEYGISYDLEGSGGGSAVDNQFIENFTVNPDDPGTDIIVHDRATPLLQGNHCSPRDGQPLPTVEEDGADGSGIVYFYRGLANEPAVDIADNACAVAVCGLSPLDEELQLLCEEVQ